MDRNEFYKLNTLHGDKYLNNEYCEKLYEYYVKGGDIYKYKIEISYDDFSKVFSMVYETLNIKLSEEEIKKAFLQYIQLLMSDARSGKYVDINYFIKCLDYVSIDILDNYFLKKSKCLVKKMKTNLRNEFRTMTLK